MIELTTDEKIALTLKPLVAAISMHKVGRMDDRTLMVMNDTTFAPRRVEANCIRTSWSMGPSQRFVLGPPARMTRAPGASTRRHSARVWLPATSNIRS